MRGTTQRQLRESGELPKPTYIDRIDRKTLHAAMRTEVLERFPELAELPDEEIGAAFAAIPAYDAGDKAAVSRAVTYQRECARYLAAMERAIAAEQQRLKDLFP